MAPERAEELAGSPFAALTACRKRHILFRGNFCAIPYHMIHLALIALFF